MSSLVPLAGRLPATGQQTTHASAVSETPSLENQLPALRLRLMRQARVAVADASLAEDLVQETLLAMFEQEAKHRAQASLATWGTAILKNKIADWYRSPNRKRFVQATEEESDGELNDGVAALYDAVGHYVQEIPSWQQPENRMEQRQMFTVLEQCVDCLPRQTGRVFMMREWLGFETAEICSRLNLSAENCRMILHRARMGLRQCMQHNWLDAKVVA
ncbi:MAG: sigma-70 family RNA polymerase sigma factor [Rhodoferax sp.]|uniref:sigma-70 family RNA polymerase sigma factor n=1 Tax=Rhodoferax sp. TaxID=50421 RepID=UPI002601B364|nr:sigma-70 family RNA polymerase sigma factor [Rhodoferax sp.]MDD5332272.1 sigma-70 family RNA polymerase sigma factor [Rhodoferax sp.]